MELLIVIAVIAILIALLLGGMRMARATARSAQCTSIMRQWVQAFPLYAADHYGYLPTANVPANQLNVWQENIAPYLVSSGSEFILRAQLHCPGDTTAATKHTWAYAISQYLVPGGGYTPVVHKMVDIPHPEITLLLVESDNATMQHLYGAPANPCVQYTRHGNNNANFAFADMHIQSMDSTTALASWKANQILLDPLQKPGF